MEAERQYVTLELHDAQLGRIEALIERNLARQEAIASDIKGEIKLINAKIDAVEQKLEAKIDGVMDAVAITNSRIDDLHNKKGNSIALWAIFVSVAGVFLTTVVGVYQLFVR